MSEEDTNSKQTDTKICDVPFIGELFAKNFNISENIVDAYYSQVPQPTTREQTLNYNGNLKRYNQPFKVSIYGAYPLMLNWEMLQVCMKNVNDESGFYNDYNEDAVLESLKDFAKGFHYGFYNFLKEGIDSPTFISNTEAAKVRKVLNFLSSPFNVPGFSTTHGPGKKPFENWYNDGIQAGHHYCVWYIILESDYLFESYLGNSIADQSVSTPNVPVKLFYEFLLHDKREILAKKIKQEYSTERGRGIRSLIDVLEDRKILSTEGRQKKAIFQAIQNYFNRDIGKYQAVFPSAIPTDKNSPEFLSAKAKLEFILNSIKK